jgi:formylglycine-generating enzyme required for sulfatase activity
MRWTQLSLPVLFAPALSLALASTAVSEEKDWFESFVKTHKPTEQQKADLQKITSKSHFIGQGNPKITAHPMTREQCLQKAVSFENPEFEKICGARYMAPLYDPSKEKPADAKACIDQFEFPNIPCEYPVVWTRADEAAEICEAMGKRLCDAHEWEGGCAGALLDPDYDFAQGKGQPADQKVRERRKKHNASVPSTWAYGDKFRKGVCGANSVKFDNCNGGDWNKCGSNTYPAGSFPDCKSTLGVYDQHGNAAEHMNLPLEESEMASKGSKTLGYTEMKGSWFIWDKFQAHPDQCRWRAQYWHGSKVRDPKSHHNYHLGFRCCKTLNAP